MFFYILIFPTVLNTILLIVMAFVLYKLLVLAGDLSYKMGKFMDRGEEEIFSTASAFRHLANQGGDLLEKFTQLMDRYMIAYTIKQSPAADGQRWSKLMSGLSIGYNIFNYIMQMVKKKKQ